jgi:hypothetical protein
LKRGPKQHGYSDEGIETRIAEFFGGIKERIILFSAETGISAGWVAERISTLLSPERERVLHNLSIVQLASARNGGTVEPLALAVDAHQRETQSSTVGTTGETANYEDLIKQAKDAARRAKDAKRHREIRAGIKRPYTKGAVNAWTGMTPEERSKEMKRRQKTAKANKALKAAGIKPKYKRSGVSMEKQKIYVARSQAKKARALAQMEGKPLPPMPPLPGREA